MNSRCLVVSAFSITAASLFGINASAASCSGTVIKRVCMYGSGSGCNYPQDVGSKLDVETFVFHNRKRYYDIYRLGDFEASSINLEKGCKLKPSGMDLSPLLRGFERKCGPLAAFETFRRSVANVDDKGKVTQTRPVLPSSLGGSADSNIKIMDDYALIQVDVTGVYRGLNVAGIDLSNGIQNGISSASILFAASPEEVASALGNGWSLSQRTVTSEHGSSFSYLLRKDGPFTRANCDWSM